MNVTPTTRLRRATAADAELIYRWRNDPAIVVLGQSQRPVDFAEHRVWFAAALTNPNRLIMIVEADDEPVGQLRFDRICLEDAEVTIYLIGDRLGSGHGGRAMGLGEAEVLRRWPSLRRMQAAVLLSNDRSLNYFAKM